VVIPSNRFGSFSQSQTQTYEWRTFLVEFFYGLLTIVWLLLALPEMAVLKGLTRLEKLALSSCDDPSMNSGGRSEPCDESESSIVVQFNEIHAPCYELESARLDKLQYLSAVCEPALHFLDSHSDRLNEADFASLPEPSLHGSNHGPMADVQGVHGRQGISCL
jgi:hypothetical protein